MFFYRDFFCKPEAIREVGMIMIIRNILNLNSIAKQRQVFILKARQVFKFNDNRLWLASYAMF